MGELLVLFARAVMLAFGLTVLTGCAERQFAQTRPVIVPMSLENSLTDPDPVELRPIPEAEGPQVSLPHIPPPPRKPTPPAVGGNSVVAAKTPARPTPPPIAPERLVGMAEHEMTGLLGDPVAVHKEGMATVWRYVTDQCRMDVFFFADLTTNENHVLTYEIDADPGIPADRCLQRLQLASGQNE